MMKAQRRCTGMIRGLGLFAAVVLIGLALTLQAAAQSAVTDSDTDPVAPEQQVEIEPLAQDDEIAQRIARILTATGWYSNISVVVDEGVAFLEADSGTDAHRTWAQNLAAKTTGVVAVVNRIRVDDSIGWSFAPALEELERLGQEAVAALPLFGLAVLILPLAWYAARLVSALVRWVLGQRVRTPFLRHVISRAVAFPVFLIGLYIVLQVAGLTQLALSLVGGAGVLGIVIGFAFRDIAENFLSSLILSVQRPFQRGDLIEVAGIQGTVKSMTTRSTLLSSVEGNEIHIPNSTIFKNVIENRTSSPNQRGDFVVGIGYDTVVPEVQSIILDCLQRHPAVLPEPEPMVLVDALGASTVNIRTYYWFNGHLISPIKLQSALLRAVKTALMNEGVSMPDEAREVIFPQGVHVITGDTETAAPSDLPPTRRPAPVEEPDATQAEGDLLTDTPPDPKGPAAGTEGDLLSST